MSHVVTIQTQARDPAAVAAACRRLGLAEPARGTARLFSGEATGLLVQLPGWLYPVVIDTATGTLHFDNYEGSWGEQARLERDFDGAPEHLRIDAVERWGTEPDSALAECRDGLAPARAPLAGVGELHQCRQGFDGVRAAHAEGTRATRRQRPSLAFEPSRSRAFSRTRACELHFSFELRTVVHSGSGSQAGHLDSAAGFSTARSFDGVGPVL